MRPSAVPARVPGEPPQPVRRSGPGRFPGRQPALGPAPHASFALASRSEGSAAPRNSPPGHRVRRAPRRPARRRQSKSGRSRGGVTIPRAPVEPLGPARSLPGVYLRTPAVSIAVRGRPAAGPGRPRKTRAARRRPLSGACKRTRERRPGGTTPGLPLLAGARVGFRRAPETVRRLAALHLQSPFKHVTRN